MPDQPRPPSDSPVSVGSAVDKALEALHRQQAEREKRLRQQLWLVGVLLVAAVGAAIAYARFAKPGVPLTGSGHVAKLSTDGSVWAFFLEGNVIGVTPESAQRLNLGTQPCSAMRGRLLENGLIDLDEVTCEPGRPVLRAVGERLRRLGHKFGYWPDGLERTPADDPEPHLATVELLAAMIDPRAQAPQVLWLYEPLFPATLEAARARGALPPPVFIHVKRNDILFQRWGRSQVERLMQRPEWVVMGAAAAGGWLVRRVELQGHEPPTADRLLIDPEAAPWPEVLRSPTLRLGVPTPETNRP